MAIRTLQWGLGVGASIMNCEIGSLWEKEGWQAWGECLCSMGWCPARGQLREGSIKGPTIL